MKTHGPTISCLQKIHFKPKDTDRLKVKGWKKLAEESKVAILISNRIDFKIKKRLQETKACILIKDSIQQEDTSY